MSAIDRVTAANQSERNVAAPTDLTVATPVNAFPSASSSRSIICFPFSLMLSILTSGSCLVVISLSVSPPFSALSVCVIGCVITSVSVDRMRREEKRGTKERRR